jgi:2-amino-4-hydroxy-6-hydroxymethyldihydropteridine diphosphokinase
MHTILLSIGSNTFAKTNIDKAKRMLVRTFSDIVFSSPTLTEPSDEKYVFPFRNILARFDSELTPQEIKEKTKMIEVAVGRSPKDKYLGRVIIDIDVIKCGDEVLRPNDYNREYMQELLVTF